MSLGSLRAGNMSTKRRAQLVNGKAEIAQSSASRSPEPMLMRPRSRFSLALGRHSLSAVSSPAFRDPASDKKNGSPISERNTTDVRRQQSGSEIESIEETDDEEDDGDSATESDSSEESESESDSDGDSSSDNESSDESETDTESGSMSDIDDDNKSDSDSASDNGSESTIEDQSQSLEEVKTALSEVAQANDEPSVEPTATVIEPSHAGDLLPGTLKVLQSLAKSTEMTRDIHFGKAANIAEMHGRVDEAEELTCLALSYTTRSRLFTRQLRLTDFYLRAHANSLNDHSGVEESTGRYLRLASSLASLAKENASTDGQGAQAQLRVVAASGGDAQATTEDRGDSVDPDRKDEAKERAVGMMIHRDSPPRMVPLSVCPLPAEEMRKISHVSDTQMTRSFASPRLLQLTESPSENESQAAIGARLHAAATRAEAKGCIAEADELFTFALSYTSRSKLCLAQLGLTDFYLRAGSNVLADAMQHDRQTTEEVQLVAKYLNSARAMAELARANARTDREGAEAKARNDSLDVVEASFKAFNPSS
jgi:hypothetical protein